MAGCACRSVRACVGGIRSLSLCVCVRLELTEVIGRWARACACVHVWWQRDDYDDFTDRSVGGWYGGYQHCGGSLTASHALGCGESQRPDARAPHSGRRCWCAAVLAVWRDNRWDKFLTTSIFATQSPQTTF